MKPRPQKFCDPLLVTTHQLRNTYMEDVALSCDRKSRHNLQYLYFSLFQIPASLSLAKSGLGSVGGKQVSISCIMCHCTGEAKKKKATTTKMSGCFSLRALLLFQLLKDTCSDSFCSAVQSGPSVIPRSSSCCPDLRSTLNKTSRRAVRDQLTLKLLDFALKAPAPQMSTELCRHFFYFFFCLSVSRPCLRARGAEVNTASAEPVGRSFL